MDSQSQLIREAYQDYDRRITMDNFKVACILGMLLVPAFSILDFQVYERWKYEFLAVRLICCGLIGIFLTLLLTEFGKRNYRFFTVTLVLLPASAICYMIARVDHGAVSPYYAGLNLVLLMTGFVLRWTFKESLLAVTLVVLEYLLACRIHGPLQLEGFFVNNLFFLLATAIIVVTGNYYYSQVRFREFSYRYQLDLNKQELEMTNNKLSQQNTALEKANREIKEAEAQLVQSEKMSSLGRYSAGLMHDILNPINFANQGLFLLQKRARSLPAESQEKFMPVINDISDGLKRIQNIVFDLRTFTHPGEQPAELVDLAEVFNVALRFVSSELKEKDITVQQDVIPGQRAWISRNQFILVLVNLLENSVDALEGKSFTNGEKPFIRITSSEENGRSLIFIRDNGPGIPEEIMPKIFDPFFTTKDIGKGTGLGLSICFGIVRGYGGTIRVNTEAGRFCEFILDLPAGEMAMK